MRFNNSAAVMVLRCNGDAGHRDRRCASVKDEINLKRIKLREVGKGADDCMLC